MSSEQLSARERQYRQRRNVEDLESILGVSVEARHDTELGRTLFAAAGVVVSIDDRDMAHVIGACSSRSVEIARRIREAIATSAGPDARCSAIAKHPDLESLGHSLQRAIAENS